MKKLKVVALLVVMMCGLVGCKEDVEVHTEYVKAQPLQLYTEEVVQETVEQAKVSAEIAIEEVEKEFSPYYVAVSSLNIRQAPDTNSSLVGSLVFGDYINAYVDGEWAELNNGTYVSAEYLTSELLYTAYAAPYTSGMKAICRIVLEIEVFSHNQVISTNYKNYATLGITASGNIRADIVWQLVVILELQSDSILT